MCVISNSISGLEESDDTKQTEVAISYTDDFTDLTRNIIRFGESKSKPFLYLFHRFTYHMRRWVFQANPMIPSNSWDTDLYFHRNGKSSEIIELCSFVLHWQQPLPPQLHSFSALYEIYIYHNGLWEIKQKRERQRLNCWPWIRCLKLFEVWERDMRIPTKQSWMSHNRSNMMCMHFVFVQSIHPQDI